MLSLDEVKKYLNINSSEDDEKIMFILRYAEVYAKTYCKIDEISSDMKEAIYMMCLSLYNAFDGKKKISIGDISYEYQQNSETYKNILNKFRKVFPNECC